LSSFTDPAAEFADLCRKISGRSQEIGEHFLAGQFQVAAWSYEFYQIIFCIIERAELLKTVLAKIESMSDVYTEAVEHIDDILQAFHPSNIRRKWSDAGANHVHARNIQPIRMLSPTVRQHIKYPLLNDAERDQILILVNDLMNWLETLQLTDRDFIRQAILDGLKQFHFRLERVGWLGWGYTVESLKDVIGAYFALERGVPLDGGDPQAEAILKKVSAGIRVIYEKVGMAKDITENADFMLKAYGAASVIMHVAKNGINGLLTFG
jgi:hypothetical protein